MDSRTFDTLTRRARSAGNRRASLKALGAATLVAAFATPLAAEAGTCGKKVKKRCQQLKAQCIASVEGFCESEGCLAKRLPCCDSMATCNASAALDCLFEGIL
jgi:hypothetical protein